MSHYDSDLTERAVELYYEILRPLIGDERFINQPNHSDSAYYEHAGIVVLRSGGDVLKTFSVGPNKELTVIPDISAEKVERMNTPDSVVRFDTEVVDAIEGVYAFLSGLQGWPNGWLGDWGFSDDPLCFEDIEEAGLTDLDEQLLRKQLLYRAQWLSKATAALIDIANEGDVKPILARLNKHVEAARATADDLDE